jgi:hypothetical protein
LELRYDIRTTGQEALDALNARTTELSKNVSTSSGLVDAYGISFGRATAAVTTHASALGGLRPVAAGVDSDFRKIGDTLQSHTVPQMVAASAALRGLDGSMNIRAAERFLTQFQGINTVLQGTFQIFGALALGGGRCTWR